MRRRPPIAESAVLHSLGIPAFRRRLTPGQVMDVTFHNVRRRDLQSAATAARRIILASCLLASACGENGTPSAPNPPNVQGRWLGGNTTQSCTATQDLVTRFDACSAQRSPFFDLNLTQRGSVLTGILAVATFECSVCPVQVTGTVSASGAVSLSGNGQVRPGIMLDVSNWDTQVRGSSMIGAFTFTLTESGAQVGTMKVRANLFNVIREG